ncbi:MAG: hypothetical protein AAFZ15_01035 [Bacteroidota bacterium]
MKNISALLLLVFLSADCMIAQKENKIIFARPTKKYLVEGQFYKFKKLEPFFNQFPDTRKAYENRYMAAKRTGQVALGLTMTSVLALSLPYGEDRPGEDGSNIGMGIMLAGTAFVSFVVSITAFSISETGKPKLIKLYNNHFSEETGFRSQKNQYRFGLSANGVGLVVNF